ncbi:MAG TPA: PepSY domain-containing protein [Actinomycetota bacterium]
MKRSTKLIAGSTVALAAIGGGTGAAVASGALDDDAPLEGTTLDQAVAAALAATGGGEVLETEVGDDGAAYGVEVRLADGRQVEVNLDANFAVIGQEADHDDPNEQG